MSRRSAIWAGLKWSHPDAKKMLRVKDWNSELIPGTNVTYGEGKKNDFNLPAPLDCTNISLIYDTDWHVNYKKTGDHGDIFRENVRYGMMNGEPGFSFDMYDNEGETSRNAPVSGRTLVTIKRNGDVLKEEISKIVLLGWKVTIWTGLNWAHDVEFKCTNEDAEIISVTFEMSNNGHYHESEIYADPSHEFILKGSSSSEDGLLENLMEKKYRVKAKDLSVGMSLLVSNTDSSRPSQAIITKLEKMPNEPVFCCDVRLPEHSFEAEGIIISNCTEITSSDDSDVCNLGSINLAEVNDIDELSDVVNLATKFLIHGTLKAELPYEKVYKTREKNRRLGLGLMGIHEWLLVRRKKYEVDKALHHWLEIYQKVSDKVAKEYSDKLSISRPVAVRAIAPTGTIGIIAGTTTGIEPVYSVAYKRRYMRNNEWHCEYVVDSTAQYLIEEFGVHPESIETALELSMDIERRVKFQADVQHYVDQGISSTINLPRWDTDYNNEDMVDDTAALLAKYSSKLRGITFYPDGARGGQPLVPCGYEEAMSKVGQVFIENHDACKGGVCGL